MAYTAVEGYRSGESLTTGVLNWWWYAWCRVQGFGFRAEGLGFRVSVLGFGVRVYGLRGVPGPCRGIRPSRCGSAPPSRSTAPDKAVSQ